jgi:DNA (cytosine-5)-methyltransferase 1
MMPRGAGLFIAKKNRLCGGARARVLDICGGAGGFSLGFKSAGYDLVGAVEIDAVAASTYALNLHKEAPEGKRARFARARDLSVSGSGFIARDLQLCSVEASVDVLLAGLPCQAFARIGRSKLRSVADDPEAYRTDPRASLYRRFLKYVDAFKPLAILVENVPDILNHGGHNVPEEISDRLSAWGYRCRYSLLNAANYGVPQLRERLFLIALHDSLGLDPAFPVPTHRVDIPAGYANNRSFALKNVDLATSHYITPPAPDGRLFDGVTVREALEDLAPIWRRRWQETAPIPSRRITDLSRYIREPAGYSQVMRTWRGFPTGDSVDAHVARHTPRDYPLFSKMAPGEQYPEMHRRAVSRFEAAVGRRPAGGVEIEPDSEVWRLLRSSMVPPYDPEKFPNRWRKLDPDKPSCTVTAHLGKDTYSHIHYDGGQARTITVREAARLQSFPDGFVFSGTMNSAFRQIGNAVPPLMALAIASRLNEILGLRGSAGAETGRGGRRKAAA